jgi:hypothetical protein
VYSIVGAVNAGPQASNVFMNLPPGNYTVTAADSGNAGCSVSSPATVAVGVDDQAPVSSGQSTPIGHPGGSTASAGATNGVNGQSFTIVDDGTIVSLDFEISSATSVGTTVELIATNTPNDLGCGGAVLYSYDFSAGELVDGVNTHELTTPLSVGAGDGIVLVLTSSSSFAINFSFGNTYTGGRMLFNTCAAGDISWDWAAHLNMGVLTCISNFTAQLDGSGMVSVAVADINNGATDNCGIASMEFVSSSEFIVNGDFENTDAWVLPNPTSGYTGTGGNPGTYMYLNWSPSANDPTAEQLMTGLVIGATYTITGDTRNVAGCCGAAIGVPSLAIDIDNVEQTVINNPGGVWTPFSYDFVATSTSHTLGFRAEINGGDVDMGIDNISVTGPPTNLGTSIPFTCTSLGDTTVILQVTDINGNAAVCTSVITVEDVTDPNTPTLANVTGECDATATAPTTTDNCAGTITGTTTDPLTYTAQGTYTITWTFDDGNGNVIMVDQDVVVEDVTAPSAVCISNLTVNLDVTEMASVNAAAINNSSSDNCGTANVSITSGQTAYTCADIGQTYEVTLTVDDGNATSANSTCSTMVTVGDVNGFCCDAAITNIATTDESCPDNDDGTITVTASCTSCTTIQYSIGGAFQASNLFEDVAAGTYTVTIQDSGDPNCTATTSVTIAEPTAVVVTFNAPENLCVDAGVQTGLSGGTPVSDVLAADDFSYADGSLVPNGGWANFSGTDFDMLVTGGQVRIQHGTPSEDASLAFTPTGGGNIY